MVQVSRQIEGKDIGKMILRTLNYLPNDDVKSEHNLFATYGQKFYWVTGNWWYCGKQEKPWDTSVLKIKRKVRIIYTPSILNAFEPLLMKIALRIVMTVTEIRHTI